MGRSGAVGKHSWTLVNLTVRLELSLQCDVMTHGKNREVVTRALHELAPRLPLRDVQIIVCGRLLKGRRAKSIVAPFHFEVSHVLWLHRNTHHCLHLVDIESTQHDTQCFFFFF